MYEKLIGPKTCC